MDRYESILRSLKAHITAYDDFEAKGRAAVATLLVEFAHYVQAPPQTCRVGPPGMSLDGESRTPIDHVAELQEDGFFAASLILKEPSPVGACMRFTFCARIDTDSTFVKLSDGGKEFRVKVLSRDSLEPFLEDVFTRTLDYLATEPHKLASGSTERRIGFT